MNWAPWAWKAVALPPSSQAHHNLLCQKNCCLFYSKFHNFVRVENRRIHLRRFQITQEPRRWLERRSPFGSACAGRLGTRGTLVGIWDPETSSLCCAPWRCARLRSPCSHGHLIQALAEDGAARTVGGARRRRTTAVRGPSLDQ